MSMNPAQRLAFWSLVADRIEGRDPGALERGRRRLQRWRTINSPSASDRYWDEWESRINEGIQAVVRQLRDPSERGDVLRSTAPFLDVVSQAERLQFLESARSAKQ